MSNSRIEELAVTPASYIPSMRSSGSGARRIFSLADKRRIIEEGSRESASKSGVARANATRAAVEEGIVPGGGVALLRARSVLASLKGTNPDVTAGISIVLRALEAPIRQIAENAGVEGSIVVGKLTDSKDQNQGFDAQTETYVDMIKAGIVDPAKVVRTALQDAGSIAALLITAEAMIAESPPKNSAPSVGDGGY